MIKKLVALGVVALLALLLLPATSAEAKAGNGGYVGCYGIKKKGNYNDVRLGVFGKISNGKVAAVANEGVSASCQRVNSLPVINMHIYWAIVRVNGVNRTTSGSIGNGGTKASIRAQSSFVGVKCGVKITIFAKVSYSYYDKAQVRPFVFHGPAFTRC